MRSVKIYLVGGGPGDPYLLTLKAKEILAGSEVVLYDNLVSKEVLDFIPKKTKKIFVGKRSHTPSYSQLEINQILLKQYRLLTKKKTSSLGVMVRLKGGDPLVFGRIVEELNHLITHQIPFEIVPGISSFQGGMIFGGIPFTDRNNSSSFAVVTGHYKKGDETKKIQTSNADTVIYMMGMNRLLLIIKANLKSGKDPKTPVAIIENATRLEQRVITGDLSDIKEKSKKEGFKSPCIIVIGQVVSLRKICDWWSSRPLLGKTVLLVEEMEINDKTLKKAFEMEGAKVTQRVSFSSILDNAHCKKLEVLLKRKNILLFSSASSIQQLMEWIKKENKDVRVLHQSILVGRDEKTCQALKKHHLKPDISYEQLLKKKINTPLIFITDQNEVEFLHPTWLNNKKFHLIKLYNFIPKDLSKEIKKADIICLFSPLAARLLSCQLKKHTEKEIICNGKNIKKKLLACGIFPFFSFNTDKKLNFFGAYLSFLENKQ